MRVFGSVVGPPPGFLPAFVADYLHRRAIGAKSVCHYGLWIAVSLHGFLEEFQGSSLVTALGDKTFQNFIFVIHGAPQVMSLTIYLYEHLIQMPLPLGRLTHVGCTVLSDLVGKVSAEPIDPEPYAFMSDIHSALVE